MTVLSGVLQNDGAIVEILLGWSTSRAQQQRAALRPVPPPLQAQALLDTGAEMTCVDAALIQQLGLHFGGMVPANLPAHGGLTFGALHHALPNLSVLELSLASLGYQALIGRDVLARCRFLYDGPGNSFRLTY